MIEQGKQANQSIKKSLNLKAGINHFAQENVASKYYGIAQNDKTVKRFKLILRSGKQISIPYAFLPVIIFENGNTLKINSNDLLITITGRGLKNLEEYFSNELIRWVKESVSGSDMDDDPCFINNIEIEGELDI